MEKHRNQSYIVSPPAPNNLDNLRCVPRSSDGDGEEYKEFLGPAELFQTRLAN